jgi:hypothetical protein
MPKTIELKQPGPLLVERTQDERATYEQRFIVLQPGRNVVSDEDFAVLRGSRLVTRLRDARLIDDVSGRDVDWKALQPPVVKDPDQDPLPSVADVHRVSVSSRPGQKPTAPPKY